MTVENLHSFFEEKAIKGGERAETFLGGLDWTVLAGKEMMGKSSDRVGGGEEVAGVLEAGVPFPPAHTKAIDKRRKEDQRVKLSSKSSNTFQSHVAVT